MNKILIIQTAFLGDVVLATALVEKWKSYYPDCQIDMMVRKGNEGLLAQHPHLRKTWVWDKQHHKYSNLWALLQAVRTEQYDLVVNVQRFGATGLFTWLSGAKITVGFSNNPFAWAFTHQVPHQIGNGTHEIARNQLLISRWTDTAAIRPVLYPSQEQQNRVATWKQTPYICIAPTSVWFTKQYPQQQWVDLLVQLPTHYQVHLLGSPTDQSYCDEIIRLVAERGNKTLIINNLCGKLNLLESAALMQDAHMNYVNDSAPLHLSSAVDAPVCAVFCSTVPSFGFTPLSKIANIVETEQPLSCRPCGLHGYKTCPQGHFECATSIQTTQLLSVL